MGLGIMSMHSPKDARFPFSMTGHLVTLRRGSSKICQLLLSSSMHPCNRVTLFCGNKSNICGYSLFLSTRTLIVMAYEVYSIIKQLSTLARAAEKRAMCDIIAGKKYMYHFYSSNMFFFF